MSEPFASSLRNRAHRCALGLLLGLSATAGTAHAQSDPLLDETHTIAASTVAAPVEHVFDISVAGAYKLTLTDLGQALTPSAPLASVKLAITNGSAIVGTALTGAGSMPFSATPGRYEIHVVGTPGTVAGSGPIGVTITDAAGKSQIAAFSDTLAVPAQALPDSESVLDDTFTVTASGSYQVSLKDLQLPQSLGLLTLLLIPEGSGAPLAILPDASNGNALQATVSLSSGVEYRIFAVGQVSTGADAGLYSVVVGQSGGGSIAYQKAVPVGATTLLGSPALTAGSNQLVLKDLSSPAALAGLSAVLVLNGQSAAQLASPGTQSFTASAGTYQLFAVATPVTTAPGAGSYAAHVGPTGGQAAFGVARGVTGPGSELSAYSFDVNLGAGDYTVSLTDFGFPANLASVNLLAVQAGSELGAPLQRPGDLDITASAAPLSLLVFAQPGAGGSLFGIDVTSASTPNPVYDVTQAVGALFTARKVSITSAGNYAISATDLGFPAPFANYDIIVTQGTQRVGSIYGGGTFPFTATAGNYFVNFLAQPGGADMAGTYALSVSSAPAPVLTLSASAPTVVGGGTVTLSWSSQNATACTGSGGWSGSQPPSGSSQSLPLTVDTTFTLTCSGTANQMVTKSVTVTIAAPSKGGGGAVGWPLVSVLATLFTFQQRRSRDLR